MTDPTGGGSVSDHKRRRFMVSIRLDGRTPPAPSSGVPSRCAPRRGCAAPERPASASDAAGQRPRRRGSAEPSASAAPPPDCGTDPVELNAYFETGFDLPVQSVRGVHQAVPERHVEHQQDQFTNLMTATPRLLSGDNPPDLIRLPSMVTLVKDGLLRTSTTTRAYGWDQWPACQLAQNRVAEDGTRGSGRLYAMGLNYSLTGVFYNKEQAALGMTAPPATLAEFDDLLAKAKDAGVLPIMQWNATASGGARVPAPEPDGRLRPDGPINDWIFQKAGATIDTPTNLQAAQHLQGWVEAGYFPEDANAIEYTDANAASATAKACSCSTATGRTPGTTRICRTTSGSSSFRRPRPVGPARRCRPR